MSRRIRWLITSLLGATVVAACSSASDPTTSPTGETTDTGVATPTDLDAASGWVQSPATTPDYASWVVFCCDGDIPESPDLPSESPPNLAVGVYPVRIVNWVDDSPMTLEVSRYKSCEDDAFRNSPSGGCLDPDPERPHDAAIDTGRTVEFSLDLASDDVTVHVLGHDCGPDGSVRVVDWTASGMDLEQLADDFDLDYTNHLLPIATNEPFFTGDTDLAGLGTRYAETCTDVGAVWTDAPGPSVWLPGPRDQRLLPESRPLTDFVWARSLVVGTDGFVIFLYAGYTP